MVITMTVGQYHAQPGTTLTVTDCTFVSTRAVPNQGLGGAIAMFPGVNTAGSLTVINSTITGSTSYSSGGAIYAASIPVNIVNSTITNNAAGVAPFDDNVSSAAEGGAIYNGGQGGILTIMNSTISGNTGRQSGAIVSGNVTVTNSTISGNTSKDRDRRRDQFCGPVTITNSTITGNSAKIFAGGINIPPIRPVPATIVSNSIIAGNTAPTGPDVSGNFSTERWLQRHRERGWEQWLGCQRPHGYKRQPPQSLVWSTRHVWRDDTSVPALTRFPRHQCQQ